MSERPQSPGRVLCHLYYVTEAGGIAVLDANTSNVNRLISPSGSDTRQRLTIGSQSFK